MNVLVLMSDQHNPKVLGAAGHPIVRTPNLDRLAATGTRFSAAYTPSPICVPARAAWTTGLPVHETGYWDNAIAYDGRIEGWTHAVQRAGVRVESIGKLHYVDADAPTGFDRQIEPMHISDRIGQLWGSIRDPLPRRPGAHRLVSTAGPGESDYTRYDARIADAACAWLGEAGRDGRPFVLYVGFVAPHFPYVAPQRFFDLYDPASIPRAKLHPDDGHERHPWVEAYASVLVGLDGDNSDEERRRATAAYYGLVSYLDDNVGKVVDALHAAGLAEDTVVVYTSDHGDTVGSRGLWGKSVLYEESAGVPLVVSGPGVPAGRVSRTPTTLLDGYRTIVEVAGGQGAERPATRSWVTLASSPDDLERAVLSEYHAFGSASAGFLVRKGRHKLHHYVGFEPELFDLAEDPEETVNLAQSSAYRDVRSDLEATLREMVVPEVVDRRAKADQLALVEAFGGPEVAAGLGTAGATPAPGA